MSGPITKAHLNPNTRLLYGDAYKALDSMAEIIFIFVIYN